MKHKLTSFIITCFGLVATVAAQPILPWQPRTGAYWWAWTAGSSRWSTSNKKAEG